VGGWLKGKKVAKGAAPPAVGQPHWDVNGAYPPSSGFFALFVLLHIFIVSCECIRITLLIRCQVTMTLTLANAALICNSVHLSPSAFASKKQYINFGMVFYKYFINLLDQNYQLLFVKIKNEKLKENKIEIRE